MDTSWKNLGAYERKSLDCLKHTVGINMNTENASDEGSEGIWGHVIANQEKKEGICKQGDINWSDRATSQKKKKSWQTPKLGNTGNRYSS